MEWMDEFETVFRASNDGFVASIPVLGLVAKGENLNAALSLLADKKRAMFRELSDTGQIDWIRQILSKREPSAAQVGRTMPPGGLGTFAGKTAIIAAAVCISIYFLYAGVVQRTLELTKVGGTQFWSNVQSELSRLADPRSEMPDAQKQQLLKDIKTVVDRWHPFIVEISPLFSGEQKSNPQRQ